MAKIKQFFLKINNESGFSLTELMLATSIISVIATLSAAQFDNVLSIAKDAQRKANIRQVYTALNLYYDNNIQYPITSNSEPTTQGWLEMKELLENPEEIYMPEVPQDPQNTDEYTFKYWSDGQTFQLTYETEDPNDNSPVVVWGI